MKKQKCTFLYKQLIIFILIIATVATLAGCAKKEPEITASFISNKLEAVSELISAKLTYQGIIQYKDGNVPFFTQKEFLMVYGATVKAGIDLSQITIDVTDKNVTIRLPADVSIDINVDPDSIVFYAEKNALFNKENKEDVLGAIKAAEEDIMQNGGIEELKATAKEEAILLIKSLIEELIGERSLTVIG